MFKTNENTEMYAIRDIKGDFELPFGFMNQALAVRAFAAGINQTGSMMNTAPEDFELWHVGSYNKNTGNLTASKPELIVNGKSVLKE